MSSLILDLFAFNLVTIFIKSFPIVFTQVKEDHLEAQACRENVDPQASLGRAVIRVLPDPEVLPDRPAREASEAALVCRDHPDKQATEAQR